MEQITVLTFKTLLWLPMTAGNSIISSSRDNLSIQQAPINPCEDAKLKRNCADKQLLKRQHLFTSTFLIILILCVFLPVSRYQIHTNPSQTQLQRSTDRRAPVLLFTAWERLEGPTSLLKSNPRAHDRILCRGFLNLSRRSPHIISGHPVSVCGCSHGKVSPHIQVELAVLQFSSFK